MTIYLVMANHNIEYLQDFIHTAFSSKEDAETFCAYLQELQQQYLPLANRVYRDLVPYSTYRLCRQLQDKLKTSHMSATFCVEPLEVCSEILKK